MLEVQHQHVEALRLLAFRVKFRRQTRDLRASSVRERFRRQHSPGLGLGVLLDDAPPRPYDEVVEVHAGHFRLQQRGDLRPHLVILIRVPMRRRPCLAGRLAVGFGQFLVQLTDQLQPRRANSRLPSDSPSAPSVAGRFWLKYSRFWQ
jgi:hypothetical protein